MHPIEKIIEYHGLKFYKVNFDFHETWYMSTLSCEDFDNHLESCIEESKGDEDILESILENNNCYIFSSSGEW